MHRAMKEQSAGLLPWPRPACQNDAESPSICAFAYAAAGLREQSRRGQDQTLPQPPAPQPDDRDERDQKCRRVKQSSCRYLLCLFLKAVRLGMRFTLSAFFLALRTEGA